MSNLLSSVDKEQRLRAQQKLANRIALIVVEDEFLRTYIKRIFQEIIDIKEIIEFIHPKEAKIYLAVHPDVSLSCVVSNVEFVDGSIGADFLRHLRSTYKKTQAPFVLVGDDNDITLKYAFLVKHFAGYIRHSFTPANFIRMLLEVFNVRDRRREKRQAENDGTDNRPFNRLYKGETKSNN